ncbi:hypothetical protein QUF54_02385 [Candidatus Marithioploca araucensis]|uniref:Uncharacterized protein n=1 Tax=Candidatus Marithioploca araucensis TaxID=70273 RepID=A0ABT7VR85_9GAMM|nr:hypothetical protein [Candidatus Marithioploca araucensis]
MESNALELESKASALGVFWNSTLQLWTYLEFNASALVRTVKRNSGTPIFGFFKILGLTHSLTKKVFYETL